MIDAHQHFWKFNPVRDAWITPDMQVLRRDFLPEDLGPVLQAAGVTGTVAVQADQSIEETRFLLELTRKHSFIKGVVGWIDLKASDLSRRLEFFSEEEKLKGFRHIVQAESDPGFLLQDDFLRGVREIGSRGYSYDILIKYQQLPMAATFSGLLPDVPLIIDHLAKPPIRLGDWKLWAEDLKKFANLTHVYCKVSGLVTEADWAYWKPEDFRIYLEVVTGIFGTDRIIYGSDWPVCLLASDYPSQLNIIREYFSAFSSDEQAAVFHINAERFYRL